MPELACGRRRGPPAAPARLTTVSAGGPTSALRLRHRQAPRKARLRAPRVRRRPSPRRAGARPSLRRLCGRRRSRTARLRRR
eukprot:14966423-Alexandrium_andersonii.AAC.1